MRIRNFSQRRKPGKSQHDFLKNLTKIAEKLEWKEMHDELRIRAKSFLSTSAILQSFNDDLNASMLILYVR